MSNIEPNENSAPVQQPQQPVQVPDTDYIGVNTESSSSVRKGQDNDFEEK